jgi:hypothetical protein
VRSPHTATATFTRPADTTAYAANDLVANSTTAGSVVPMTLNFSHNNGVWFRSAVLRKSAATTTNANFRMWFLSALPTVTNGDNGAIAGTFLSTVLFDPIAISTSALLTGGGALGAAVSDAGLRELPSTCFVLLEATAAYTPGNAEVFTLNLLGEGL